MKTVLTRVGKVPLVRNGAGRQKAVIKRPAFVNNPNRAAFYEMGLWVNAQLQPVMQIKEIAKEIGITEAGAHALTIIGLGKLSYAARARMNGSFDY